MTNDAVVFGATAAVLYAARRYFRDWGTTKAEAGGEFPGDRLVHRPMMQATEAVDIDAPAGDTWPWLADRVSEESRHLAEGDAVRLIPKGRLGMRRDVEMRVVELVEGKRIVLFAEPPATPFTVVLSFHLMSRGTDRCRLLIRSRLGLRHPGEVLLAELFGPARAFITRGMLIGIKRRVESRRRTEAAAARADVHRVG